MESCGGSLGVTRATNRLKLLLIFSSSCLLDIGYGRVELVARERRHHVDPVVVVIVIGGRLSFVIVLPYHLRRINMYICCGCTALISCVHHQT